MRGRGGRPAGGSPAAPGPVTVEPSRAQATVPPPGSHGDDAARVARALGLAVSDVLDLATSLNPVAPRLDRIVASALSELHRYPDPQAATELLAAAIGVSAEQVLLTNGGAEAIALVASEHGPGEVVEPEFSLYRRHLPTVAKGAPRWRSNPHNPSGSLAGPSEAAAVWDEAFYPLATGSWTRGDVATGATVLGSLTKLFACPGLRLGYVLGDPSLLARLAERQPRWSVNGLACAALPKMLDLADLHAWQRLVAGLREDLRAVLATAGLEAEPSDANFVLVREAAGLRDRLAREGIVVRDCTSFGLPGAVRIAVPGSEGLERLERALARVTGASMEGSSRLSPQSARLPQMMAARSVEPDIAPREDMAKGGGQGRVHRRAPSGPLTGALHVCGTASDAGKSLIVTGLCRLLARDGVRVAPFKAQNMSLNSFATAAGHEIGRAQAIQALAAGIAPEVAMNPILLKPTSERRSQVVVAGRPVAELDAAEYQATKRHRYWPTVLRSLGELRERFDVVICEGAGSPAEINLLDGDLVNLALAEAASIPAILVGDIERGGVFAALFGTVELLPARLRCLVGGYVINKFRGDPSLLRSGIEELEVRTGIPLVGVVPYTEGIFIDAEDSLGLESVLRHSAAHDRPAGAGAALEVAVVKLPHLSNFTDLDALALEAGVTLRLVASPDELGDPDLIVLPGSKATVDDLDWLRRSGLASRICEESRRHGGPGVLGICAGYQMLGEEIFDEVESRRGRVVGLGLLPVETTFLGEKLTRPRTGRALGTEVAGYEIRQGRPVRRDGPPGSLGWVAMPPPDAAPLAGTPGGDSGSKASSFLLLEDGFGTEEEGVMSKDGRLYGTNLHGLFDSDQFRAAFLGKVARRRGKSFVARASFAGARAEQIDRVADLVEEHVDMSAVRRLIAAAGAQ
jgi:adenosylcobyric acid synthase